MRNAIVVSGMMRAGSPEAAAVMARAEGFDGFEVLLGAFGSEAALWPRTCDSERYDRLRRQLAPFRCVLVRATVEDMNIAGINQGQREESVRQYIECVDFARGIGADVISFHPGTQTWGFVSDPEEIIERNVAFGAQALERVNPDGPLLAFKTCGTSLEEMRATMERIGSERFGVDLSIGAIACREEVPADARRLTNEIGHWITALHKWIKVVHLSGVHQRWHTARLDECPFEMNNCVDYCRVLEQLGRTGYDGPLVLEIRAPNVAAMIRYAKTAREELRLYSEEGSS